MSKRSDRMTGQQVKNIRQRLDLTQLEFAVKLGVNPGSISRWERGEGRPSRICERLIKAVLKEEDRNWKEILERVKNDDCGENQGSSSEDGDESRGLCARGRGNDINGGPMGSQEESPWTFG